MYRIFRCDSRESAPSYNEFLNYVHPEDRDYLDSVLKKAVKDGMPEDEQKNGEEKLQKVHDKYIKKIDDLLAEKDKEIMTV